MLFHQESTDDAVADAGTAARATVSAGNGLAALGELSVLAGSDGGDAVELASAVTALGGTSALINILVGKLATYITREDRE